MALAAQVNLVIGKKHPKSHAEVRHRENRYPHEGEKGEGAAS